MTQGETDRRQGFSENLGVNGCSVQLRQTRITALVSRPDQGETNDQMAKGKLKFTARGKRQVEILQSAVSTIPLVGEYIIDTDSRRLRIETVSTTEFSYFLECEVDT